MPDVFINHASADAALADRLKAALEALGLTVWDAQLDLDPGGNLVTTIQKAIEDVGCVLTLWTPASIHANWVLAEARLGLRQHKLVGLASGIAASLVPAPFDRTHVPEINGSDGRAIADAAAQVQRFVRDARGRKDKPAPYSALRSADLVAEVAATPGAAVHTNARKAFISHAEEDADAANALTDYLEKADCRCWIAPRDIDPGEDYRVSILRALADVRLLVLVYSAFSNASFDVANELLLARKRHKGRLVLKMDNSEPDGPLEYEIATVQWIDGRERNAAFARVAAKTKAL